MQQTCRPLSYIQKRVFVKLRIFKSSVQFATNPATAIGAREKVKLNDESLPRASQARPAEQGLNDSESSQNALSLLDPLETKPEVLDIKSTVQKERLIDKSPLPFDEIPSPLVLKLWEKYWKYVPLLGTQLFRSLLINRFTEGRLNWNRNVTPLKYLFNEYGPVVRINGPIAGNIVLIHRPEHIAKVFEEEDNAPVRSGIDILQHYRLHHRKYRFTGPFCAQGDQCEEWIENKKALRIPITDELQKQFGKLEKTCEELLMRIHKIKNRQEEVPSNFIQELTRWGLESFWILMLNKKIGYLDSSSYLENSEAVRFIGALGTANRFMSLCETGFQVWRFFDTPFVKRLFSACDVIDEIIAKHIRTAQTDLKGETILIAESGKYLYSSIVENLLLKQRMNPDDVSTVLMDMIILGVQPTVNTQAFLLYFLAKNPRAQKILFDELKLRTQENTLNAKTLIGMPYLAACIKECLRLRPPFPYITRQLQKNIILHGYKIPKDTFVIMANQITSQREENFEDPEKFRPERWLRVSQEFHDNPSFLPFGKGLRSCVGENIALFQIMLLTAKLIQNFKIEYDYGDIKSSFYMINTPNKPLRFRFVDRD